MVITLSLGSALSLHFDKSAFLFGAIYALAGLYVYHFARSEGFFLSFNHQKKNPELQGVRVGPVVFGSQDDADRDEDKFLSLFDWKKNLVRKLTSWALVGGLIYFLYLRGAVELTPFTLAPMVGLIFLLQVVAIGHLLIPLAINLLVVMAGLSGFTPLDWVLFSLYALGVVLLLALIAPSRDRLQKLIRDWGRGKISDILRVILLLSVAFALGLEASKLLTRERDVKIPEAEFQRQLRRLQRTRSSIEDAMKLGLFTPKEVTRKVSELGEALTEFETHGLRSEKKWEEIKAGMDKLEADYAQELRDSPVPRSSPELLGKMKEDLASRSPREMTPAQFQKAKNLLANLETAPELSDPEMARAYRDLKFAPGGYYRPGTEFGQGQPTSETARRLLKEMSQSQTKLDGLSEKLRENIAAQKASPDKGLESINKVLKEEIERTDGISPEEREALTQEMNRVNGQAQELLKAIHSEDQQEKLEKLIEKNQKQLERLTPHAGAREKSAVSREILNAQGELAVIKGEAREAIVEKLPDRQEVEREEKGKFDQGHFWKRVFKLATILGGALLFFRLLSLFGKKKIKRVRGISDDVKEEIEEALAALNKRRLSPREEVIETYNVFHDALELLVFHCETPPSCIVYEGIRASEPELDGPTFAITETFAQTFYGDKDPGPGELQKFRAGVKRVFKFFSIRTS